MTAARTLLPSRVAVALLAGIGLVFALGAVRLGFWTEDGPGPGLLPFAAAVLLLPLLILALRERVPDETPFRVAPLAALALLCAYAAALPYAGFLAPTLVLAALWVRLFHGQPWWRALALSAGLVLASVVLFGTLLKVPLPLLPPQ